MTKRTGGLFALLGLGIAVAISLAVLHTVESGSEVATTALTIPVLLISAATLALVFPRPARLVVVRQEELELVDLIFYVVPQPNPAGEQQWPRDILLQLSVVACNVGGRTAVLSKAHVTAFLDDQGEHVNLPALRLPVEGFTPVAEGAWTDHGYELIRREQLPPFVIAPDAVHPLRIGDRCGIDWGVDWTLERLREAHAELARSIAAVECEVVYRSANRLRREQTRVPVQVLQQDLYRQALEGCTNGFTSIPTIPPGVALPTPPPPSR